MDSPPTGQGSTLKQMGKDLLNQLLPLLVSAGGIAALVLTVGAAVSMARFNAAGLPWEQAISAATESDMRTIGLIWLVVFGLLGLLAVTLAYIASPQGKATAAMYYALIAIATVEAGVVWYAARTDTAWHTTRVDRAAAAVLLEAAVAACLVVLCLHVRARREIAKARVDEEKAEIARQARRDARARERGHEVTSPPPKPPGDVLDGTPARRLLREGVAIVAVSAGVAWAAEAILAVRWYEVVILGLGLAILCAGLVLAREWRRAADEVCLSAETKHFHEKDDDPALALPHWAFLILGALSIGAGVGVALLFGNAWVFPSITLAGLLGLLTIRVAELSGGFRWYGVSVFFAVGLFGAAVGVLRMLDEPRLQPVAFLLKDGNGMKGVEGVYIGESDDRLWFASVALEDCEDDEVSRGSGRLRSVPIDRVTSVSIGPQMGLPSLAFEARAMLDAVRAEHPGKEPLAGPVAVRDAVALNSLGRQRGEAGRWVSLVDATGGSDEGLGRHPTIKLNGRQLRLRRPWEGDGRWQVHLPRHARSGPIYADCGERTNRAYLTVGRRPHAVLTARARGGGRWRLNAGASVDRRRGIRWYRWQAGGRSLGWGKNIAFKIERPRERRVMLAVGDSEGLEAITSVVLKGTFLRVYPSDALFCLNCRGLSEAGRRRIRALRAKLARANKVAIQVHTDERGGEARNDALSDARARAVERLLFPGRARCRRCSLKGFGETRALETNDHRRNRRVVVVVYRDRSAG